MRDAREAKNACDMGRLVADRAAMAIIADEIDNFHVFFLCGARELCVEMHVCVRVRIEVACVVARLVRKPHGWECHKIACVAVGVS